jgi:3-methyladenine DNA glycosylase AlkD/uncharacterized protein YdhG (YjbR/CyaY superfamily)
MPAKRAKSAAKSSAKTSAKPTTFEEYFALLTLEQREALEKLRTTIRAAVPTAEEGISYGLAAFRLNGKPLVALGATAGHCAFYLMSNSTVDDHAQELQKYDTSTGTIRFAVDKPLPAALVRKLVKARIAENESLVKDKSSKKKAPAVKRVAKVAPKAKGEHDVDSVLAALKRLSSKKVRDGMSRFAVPNENALGVPVGDMRTLAKKIGRNHALATALWQTNVYEARMMAAFVGEAEKVTPQQMDAWCSEFDSWAICDTVCFALFDRAPAAWTKVNEWAAREEEFVKRAAFALLASLVAHDKQADDANFMEGLQLIEAAAEDERNFVKKGVNWALRCIGKHRPGLHAAAVAMAERLAASSNPASRWIGKDALRELKSPAVKKRLAKGKRK